MKIPSCITPNVLTIFRIILTVVILSIIGIPTLTMRIMVCVLFIIAALTDFFDGYLARKTGMITAFGKIADPLADKFLILGLYIAYWKLGVFSMWWLLPILVREVVVTALRFILLARGKVIAAERMGKIKVGFQIASIGAAWLFVLVSDYAAENIMVFFFALVYITLFGSIFFTVYSGITFLRKNSAAFVDVGIARCISSVCYVGWFSKCPGTIGSLAAVILYVFIRDNNVAVMSAITLVCIIGVWSARETARQLNDPDPGEVVIDEVAGQFIAYLFIPFSALTVVLGFVLFRFFDILKPWPIKKLEHIPHGVGIMLDDIVAGIFANIVLQIVLLIL